MYYRFVERAIPEYARILVRPNSPGSRSNDTRNPSQVRWYGNRQTDRQDRQTDRTDNCLTTNANVRIYTYICFTTSLQSYDSLLDSPIMSRSSTFQSVSSGTEASPSSSPRSSITSLLEECFDVISQLGPESLIFATLMKPYVCLSICPVNRYVMLVFFWRFELLQ